MPANPFDQFDAPAAPTAPSGAAAPSANPFDQFDSHPVTPEPGLGTRLMGIGERGMIAGVGGLASTAQAAGRWMDNHTFHDPLDDKIDNFPIAANLDRAKDADHPYMPTQASGKIAEGAMAGITGGVLSGGASLAPVLTGAAVGAAVPTAKAAGATDEEANDLGVGLSLLPLAGAGVNALRTGAGNIARNVAAGRSAANMTDDQAVHTVLMNDALKQIQAASPGGDATSFQAAASYKKDLNNVATQYGQTARRAGLIDQPTGQNLSTATSQANAHNNTLTDAPGSSLAELQAPGVLPDAHAPVVNTLLRQLDATSPQQFKNASAGPFASLASTVAPYVGYASAAGSALTGHFGPVLDAIGGGVVGKMAGSTLPWLGRTADHVLGTAVTPAEADYAGALRRVQDNNLTVPTAPLTDGRALVASNQQLAGDNAAASTMSNDADKQYLYQYADAQHMNRQFDMSANQQRAYEVSDAAAMDRQRTQQQNFERAQQVGDATAMDRQLTQQQNWDDRDARSGAVYEDQQRTAQQNFERANQVSDATAMDRQRTTGANMADAAGNWLERQQIAAHKKNGPDAPITGAGMLGARNDEQLFAATGGRQGSPVEAGTPDGTPGMAGAPAAPPAGPTPPAGIAPPASPVTPQPAAPTAPAPVTAAAPPQAPSPPPVMGPFDPNGPTTGGLNLAARKVQDQTGLQPPPAQLHASANAVLSPQDAFTFTSGVRSTPEMAQQVANHAAGVMRSQAASVPQQATSEVSSLLGQSPAAPPGPPARTITSLPQWTSAKQNRQALAGRMVQLAQSPEEKLAISRVAAEPTANGKQAIRDAYAALHPGSDLSRFPPELMKGI